MKVVIPSIRMGNPRVTLSRLGYHTAPNGSFEKRLGSRRFPRLHAYVIERAGAYILDIHIDASQQSYEGTRAHKGEYAGDLIRAECDRINQILGES